MTPMKTPFTRTVKALSLALFGAFALFTCGPALTAQDKAADKGADKAADKGADKDADKGGDKAPDPAERAGRTRSRSLVREGYTRPGNPPDKMKGGQIIPVSVWQNETKEKIIGGTV